VAAVVARLRQAHQEARNILEKRQATLRRAAADNKHFGNSGSHPAVAGLVLQWLRLRLSKSGHRCANRHVRFVPWTLAAIASQPPNFGTACRCGKIDARTIWDDSGRIDGAMATVIMRLDVVEMYRFGHTRHLIKGTRVIP